MLCVDTRPLFCVLTRGHCVGVDTRSLCRVLTQDHCIGC